MTREINAAGLKLLETDEGLRLQIYKDIAGRDTIGYGHLIKPGEDFSEGITQEKAESLLKSDITIAENIVSKFIRTTLNDNQFSALVNLVFNEGYTPLIDTIGRCLNKIIDPDYSMAADAFLLWNKAHINGELVTVTALTARREREKQLFLTPV